MTQQADLRLRFEDISVDETNAILVALQELPAKICNPLSEKLRQQATTQIQQFESQQGTAGRVINHNLSEGIATQDKLS